MNLPMTPRMAHTWGLICGLVLGISVAAAQRPPERRGPPGQRLDRMVTELDLSAEQTAQVRELAKVRKAQVKPLRAQLRAQREVIRDLWQGETPDREAILAAHNALDVIRQKMRTARIDFRLALHSILSPEQRLRAKELRQQRRKMRRKRRGHHRRGNRNGAFDTSEMPEEDEQPLGI